METRFNGRWNVKKMLTIALLALFAWRRHCLPTATAIPIPCTATTTATTGTTKPTTADTTAEPA